MAAPQYPNTVAPSRARGSKLHPDAIASFEHVSRPHGRADRNRRCRRRCSRRRGRALTGARIETLPIELDANHHVVAPSRARGSKPSSRSPSRRTTSRALTGARIETSRNRHSRGLAHVAPSRARGSKLRWHRLLPAERQSRPHGRADRNIGRADRNVLTSRRLQTRQSRALTGARIETLSREHWISGL